MSHRLIVCLLLLGLLWVWAILFPQTGDGDAIMHFMCARDGLWYPRDLMGSWARVGSKLPLLIPAQFGILAARWTSAVISIICVWQTMRLADDLKLKRAILAGPLLIFQSAVFALAGDTMTEISLALGLVIAIRFWFHRKPLASCLVISFLPTVRPEGFFFCAMWGLLVLGSPNVGSISRRTVSVLSLGLGAALWAIACWIICGDPRYFYHGGWAWPADSMPIFGHGSFFAHINRWPLYCGPILFPLFLIGLPEEVKTRRWIVPMLAIIAIEAATFLSGSASIWWIRENILPFVVLPMIGMMAWVCRRNKLAILWWAFLLVFSLHTILWWRGWFASCGLMRILACVSPVTAILCLRGWNVLADQSPARQWSFPTRRWIASAAIAGMVVSAMIAYVMDPYRERIFPLQRACDYATANSVLAGAPMLILGDPMAQAYLRLPPNPKNILPNDCPRDIECDHLLKAPIGSAGFWDNQHAEAWFNVTIDDLPTLGYTVLYQTSQSSFEGWVFSKFPGFVKETDAHEVYVVIRKDRAGDLPDDVDPVESN
jgi:hypothetical protein